MDPAGPAFESSSTHRKLGNNDALFVDIIHTNGSPRQKGFGFPSSIGTVDFFANGGNDQPVIDLQICHKHLLKYQLLTYKFFFK